MRALKRTKNTSLLPMIYLGLFIYWTFTTTAKIKTVEDTGLENVAVSSNGHDSASKPCTNGSAPQNNGTYCHWTCFHGLRFDTLQATKNLYVFESDEALDVAVQQFNSLLLCVRAGRGKIYEQQMLQSNPTVSPSNTSTADNLQKQSVQRAIGRSHFAKNQYFEITKQEPRILSLALRWKPFDESTWSTGPLLIDKYYPVRNITQFCTAKPECNTSRAGADERERQFVSALSKECQDNLHVLEHHKVTRGHLDGEDLEDYPLYVHIITGGTVNSDGNVRVGQTEVIPSQCQAKQAEISSGPSQKLKEVFVISQHWGGGYFHAPIENFPRLVPYLYFLKTYPEIRIHTKAEFMHRYLRVMGLDPGRLVFGQVEADVIYLPQGGGCGTLHPVSGQLLHGYYALYIQQHLSSVRASSRLPPKMTPGHDTPSSPAITSSHGSSILLIHRTARRWLSQHEEVKSLLTRLAPKYNLTLEIYSDTNLPSFKDTMAMFSRAKLVVAPHGAGLSNAMFSRAGTRVIEILCTSKRVLCYQKLHTTLGQPYVGLLSLKRSGCENLLVDLTYLKLLVESLLGK